MKLKIDINAPENQTVIAGAIGLGIALVIYGMFVMKPLIGSIAALSQKENALKAQLQNAQVMAKDKDKLAAEVKVIEGRIVFLESRLPTQVDVAQVLEQLIKIGKETDITFVSLEPQEIKRIAVNEQSAGYAQITIKLNLRTGYHAFGKFVTAIENSQRFMSVDKIKIVSSQNDQNRHDIGVVVNAYALEGNRNAPLAP